MQGMKFRLRRKPQSHLQRIPGMVGEIHRHQYPTVWTLNRLLDHQHRTISFTHDLLRGRTEQEILNKILAVSPDQNKVGCVLPALANNFHKWRARENAKSRYSVFFGRERLHFAAEIFLDLRSDLLATGFISRCSRQYMKDCKCAPMFLGQLRCTRYRFLRT